MKILFVSPTFPYPLDTGAALRIYNIIRNLSRDNEILLASIADRKIGDSDISEMKKYCSGVFLAGIKKYPKLLQLPKVLGRFMGGRPFMVKYAESEELRNLLNNTSIVRDLDIIQFEHSYMACNVRYIDRNSKAKKVLSFHNIACAQYYRMYKVEKSISQKIKHLFEWFPMLKWEPDIAARFDASVVVSEMDKHLLQFLNPLLDISVISNGVDTKSIVPRPLDVRRKNLLFVGSMDYGPNEDAVRYFYSEVFPLVKKEVPEITLTVGGRNPSSGLHELSENPEIFFTGYVDDIIPLYEKAMLSIVPLRSGGGTRLKILEAMATGTPVVSTPVGCEGLDVKDGENIMIADNAPEFAKKIVALMSDAELWMDVSRQGRKLVEEKYDWELIARSLNDVYRRLINA